MGKSNNEHFSDNGIQEVGAQALSDGLKMNKALKTLNLSGQ